MNAANIKSPLSPFMFETFDFDESVQVQGVGQVKYFHPRYTFNESMQAKVSMGSNLFIYPISHDDEGFLTGGGLDYERSHRFGGNSQQHGGLCRSTFWAAALAWARVLLKNHCHQKLWVHFEFPRIPSLLGNNFWLYLFDINIDFLWKRSTIKNIIMVISFTLWPQIRRRLRIPNEV